MKTEIKWWLKMSLEQQFYVVIPWLKSKGLDVTSKHPNRLTEQEISEIYLWDKNRKQFIKDLLFGLNFRFKTTDTNTYRINGSVVEVLHGNWSPVAVLTDTNELTFKTLSHLGTPAWDSFLDLDKIEII